MKLDRKKDIEGFLHPAVPAPKLRVRECCWPLPAVAIRDAGQRQKVHTNSKILLRRMMRIGARLFRDSGIFLQNPHIECADVDRAASCLTSVLAEDC